ncbi:hypothetical protein DERP_012700 [Dermatophagoides pteronyssinus]|uniref:Uncharacterized protein n=1 Tax=Dermatophagoides pteronyssinus TaxID=6956 RepID=A0ABQ8IYK5_DERPT|nr:hypothetical protein DERP_012700 [Dermatophagoides pteronyssinus]
MKLLVPFLAILAFISTMLVTIGPSTVECGGYGYGYARPVYVYPVHGKVKYKSKIKIKSKSKGRYYYG